MSEQLGSFVAQHTLYAYYRPFGVTSIVGGVDEDGPQLYMIEPSGLYWVSFASHADVLIYKGISRSSSGKGQTSCQE
jgi:hypothetical protein